MFMGVRRGYSFDKDDVDIDEPSPAARRNDHEGIRTSVYI